MKTYEYFTLGAKDEYGQDTLSTVATGTLKIAINITSQSVQDNVNYKNAQYVGLTQAKVEDTYVIKMNEESYLKVLYVNPMGRYTQVFLTDYEH